MAGRRPNTINPFASSDEESSGDDMPKPMLSSTSGHQPRKVNRRASLAGPVSGIAAPVDPFDASTQQHQQQRTSNPFDFEPDFTKVKQRREMRKYASASEKDPSAEPIITGMDAADNKLKTPTNASINAGKPLTVERSKTDKPLGLAKFFKKGKSSGESDVPVEGGEEDENASPKKTVARWPYDDYHVVQELYYEKLDEQMNQPESPVKHATPSKPVYHTTSTSARPADPPDIPTAVVGLSLSDFETKAEERAITIIATWLYDAGLIDELLVHGGMASSSIMRTANPSSDDPSVKSSEGVEIGAQGYPIEGGAAKVDKEISKLRAATQRELALINARLNDGVAASGSEVQELVNAVLATKDDLGRLRELSTYIHNQQSVDGSNSENGSASQNNFLLTKYPKLKKAVNARRNLGRCFRELDFFSQIPATCDRLREELHAGEWTDHEWFSIRDVCREHVELEIFLVEAEAGMKRRIDEEETDDKTDYRRAAPKRGAKLSRFDRQSFKNAGLPRNYEQVDLFLSEHVKNVWELGDEIRLRLLSGIGSAFELAMNNPSGLVALVEAVEVYETANEEYKRVHGEEAGTKSQRLRFTDMRAAALEQINQDFENRGLEVFRDLQTQAADITNEGESDNALFSAVLRAANELTSEIGFVQHRMSPSFPRYWAVDALWSTSVAHVCSQQILQQIGGPEGHKLPDLTVTQLLDLVAWVEHFREMIEETFPDIGKINAKKTYFDARPELLTGNSKQVDMESAQDSLAWANNMLWEVHDLAKDEFLFRTKEQTDEWLDKVYDAEHEKNQTAEGRLVTSLCEDVYALVGVQLRTIRERLTRRSEALVQAVGVIFKGLYEKQIKCRDSFLMDFETCCAGSNDFIRMSDKCEEVISDIKDETTLSHEASNILEEQSNALLSLYSTDAVYAAQKVHVYVFEPIDEAIAKELFESDWLDNLTHNELALTLVRTIEDFMTDLNAFLDDVMLRKSLEALVQSTVIFYIRVLLSKSTNHKSAKDSFFSDNEKALERISGDIHEMKDFFAGLAEESMPTLERVVNREFEILDTVVELMSIAAKRSESNARDFILVLQKSVKNIHITKLVVGDIWHLVNPAEERNIYQIFDSMEDDLNAVAPTDEGALMMIQERSTVPGLRLDQMMAKHCDESKRKRPLQAGAVERTENILKNWRKTWAGQAPTEEQE